MPLNLGFNPMSLWSSTNNVVSSAFFITCIFKYRLWFNLDRICQILLHCKLNKIVELIAICDYADW